RPRPGRGAAQIPLADWAGRSALGFDHARRNLAAGDPGGADAKVGSDVDSVDLFFSRPEGDALREDLREWSASTNRIRPAGREVGSRGQPTPLHEPRRLGEEGIPGAVAGGPAAPWSAGVRIALARLAAVEGIVSSIP